MVCEVGGVLSQDHMPLKGMVGGEVLRRACGARQGYTVRHFYGSRHFEIIHIPVTASSQYKQETAEKPKAHTEGNTIHGTKVLSFDNVAKMVDDIGLKSLGCPAQF